ncbi:hydroxymethylglutaryl-CoA lyase [Brevibacillus massiliensis]|uniref:hydroxymethylglutaryl-CoA lyase n=1 Tax=Brevibacillus massiliensis TaxID=1118054 RepID=UPI0002F19E35|nr:hydroxymethylglutaryl-CoA lyase [Brevibacillus massiliensis]
MAEVQIIEVGPRDGLQNEAEFVPTEKKLQLIDKLLDAGITRMEATSFVHPKKVPQMSDASDIMCKLQEYKNVSFGALVPNRRGFERAREQRIDEVNWVTAASQTFNARNINQSIEENFEAFVQLVPLMKEAGVKIRFSIATSFGCPFEGKVDEDKVLSLALAAFKAGADEVGLADTIGIAVPDHVYSLCSKVLKYSRSDSVAIHLHDTRGLALANTYAAYTAGIRLFEAAVGGLGGCPFAPGAAGNVATEDVVYMFERMNVKTGIDFSRLLEASDFAVSLSKRNPLGRIRLVENRNQLTI